MADTDVSVRISATGGSAAADELNKVSGGLDSVGGSQKSLMDTIARPAENIALHTMNRDILDTIGYTGQARPVITAMNQAFTGMAASVGLTTSALFPYIAAAGALVAVYSHLKSSHDEEVSALEENKRALDASLKSTNDSIGEVEAYGKAVGSLPKPLAEWLEALKKLEAQQIKTAMATERTDLQKTGEELFKAKENYKDLSAAIAELKREKDSLHPSTMDEYQSYAQISAQLKLTEKQYADEGQNIVTSTEKSANLVKELTAQAQGHINNADKMKVEASAAQDSAAEQVKAQSDIAKASANRAKLVDEEFKLNAENSAQYYDSLEKWSETSAKIQLKNEEAIQRAKLGTRAIEQAVFDSEEAGFTATDAAMAQLREGAEQAYDSMMSGFGNAFAKMVVEGKNFGDSMKEVFKDILEQFLSMIAEMLIRWAAASAIMSLFPGSGLANFVAGVPGHATGANYMVDRPTLFMAGENGPEHINVNPISGGSGGSSSTSNSSSSNISISMTNNISGGSNVDQIANQIGEKIITAIRARGQINFSRA